jgi:hypothetical protein
MTIPAAGTYDDTSSRHNDMIPVAMLDFYLELEDKE